MGVINFGGTNVGGPKSLVIKWFWGTFILGDHQFLGSSILGVINFWGSKELRSKTFWMSKMLANQQNVGAFYLFKDINFWGSKIFWDQKLSGVTNLWEEDFFHLTQDCCMLSSITQQ